MRNRFAITIGLLVVMGAAIGFSLHRHDKGTEFTPELIDSETLKLVDFQRIAPAVAEFIKLAQQNQTVGQPVSAFPNLWSEALPLQESDKGERYQWHKFILPETSELKMQNDQNIATQAGVLFWPMLEVRIDSEEARIVRVVVYTQGL